MSHNAGFSLKHSYYSSSSSVVLLVVMGNNNERSSASTAGAKRRVPLKIRAVCNRSSQLCQKLSLFFPTGSYDGHLWIPDPPNGKGEPTTDPDIASLSVNALEAVVANQGPFYGILGYSQGGAFVTTFLSQTSSATFEVALIFCGYLPDDASRTREPHRRGGSVREHPRLVFMGTNDNIIPNDLSRDAAAKYSSATLVYDAVGHEVPWEATTSFQTVTAFITSPGQSDAADSVTSPGPKVIRPPFLRLRVRVVSIRVHFYDARLIEYKECYAALGQSSLCFNDELFFRGVLPFALF